MITCGCVTHDQVCVCRHACMIGVWWCLRCVCVEVWGRWQLVVNARRGGNDLHWLAPVCLACAIARDRGVSSFYMAGLRITSGSNLCGMAGELTSRSATRRSQTPTLVHTHGTTGELVSTQTNESLISNDCLNFSANHRRLWNVLVHEPWTLFSRSYFLSIVCTYWSATFQSLLTVNTTTLGYLYCWDSNG